MGTGQMMLTVMAVFLLSTVVLTSNRSYLMNTDVVVNTKIGMVETSIALSTIERACRLRYDSATAVGGGQYVVTKSLYTPYTRLGPETWERNTPQKDTIFDDFDDYNGYKDTLTPMIGPEMLGRFIVKARVVYVNPTDPYGAFQTTQTYAKRIEVSVFPADKGVKADTVFMWQIYTMW